MHFLSNDNEESAALRENLRALLHSDDSSNVRTAVEMLNGGNLPAALLDDVLFAYLVTLDMGIRERIQEVLLASTALSGFSKKYFKTYLIHPWVGLSGSEQTIRRRIKKYLEREGLDFNALQIAKMLYESRRQGYFYILEDGHKGDKLKWLQQHYTDGHLFLEGLKDLFRLPEELAALQDAQVLHLRGCGFRVFPKVLLQHSFSKLKIVDLRQNPLKEIPAKARRCLPDCSFLL